MKYTANTMLIPAKNPGETGVFAEVSAPQAGWDYLNMAARRFEHVLLLNRHVVAYGPAEQVFQPETLRQAFAGHALIMEGMMVVDECCPGDEHREHTH